MKPSQTVLIVAARCGECGRELYTSKHYGQIPYRMPVEKALVASKCLLCGGQVLLSQALDDAAEAARRD